MADIATFSRTKLLRGLQSARGTLARIREAAEVGAQRMTIGAAAVGSAYVTGRVEGWAERDGKDITIGDSEITWPVPIGAAATVVGAFGGKMLGETVANIVFGAGIGALSAEVAFIGKRHGLAPAAAA